MYCISFIESWILTGTRERYSRRERETSVGFRDPSKELGGVCGRLAVEIGLPRKKMTKINSPGIEEQQTGRVSCQKCVVCRNQSTNLVSVAYGAATALWTATATAGGGATDVFLALVLALARWRGANESVVNAECLVKELGAVQVLDGLRGFGEG
jgi:hypothetical protein